MCDGGPEGLGRLPRQGTTRRIGDGAGDHHREPDAGLVRELRNGEQGRFCVQRIKDRFDEQQIGPAIDQPPDRLRVRRHQRVEGDIARTGVFDFRRNGGRAIRRAEHPGHEARALGGLILIRHAASQGGGCHVEFIGERLHAVIGHGDRVGIERVGLENIGTGREVLGMDSGHNLRLGEYQQVIVPLEVAGPVGEPGPAIIGLLQPMTLQHGAHGAVEDKDAVRQKVAETGESTIAWRHRAAWRGGDEGGEGLFARTFGRPVQHNRTRQAPACSRMGRPCVSCYFGT